MFAKITEFRPLGRRVQYLRTAAKHNADGRADCRLITGARRARRPILTCRWHVVPSTGKLECVWRSAGASAIDEPGQKRPVAPARRLTRARARAGRPAIRRAA
jgi:hypothetical protein